MTCLRMGVLLGDSIGLNLDAARGMGVSSLMSCLLFGLLLDEMMMMLAYHHCSAPDFTTQPNPHLGGKWVSPRHYYLR